MRFALLGPVQVHGDDGPVEIRGTLRRTLLAALLLHRGSVVSADRLGELIWGERPPSSVTTSLYNQVMRLRQALGEDAERIRAVAPGYLIHVEPDELDLDEFTRRCADARQAASRAEWTDAAEQYRTALALWRGEILADVPSLHDHPANHQFTENHLIALHGRIEADLYLARHDTLIGELRTLTVTHPLREGFHAQLMLALYRAGRQADALDVYRDLRRATVTELGVEPGTAIRSLHAEVLNSAPSLTLPKQDPDTPAAPRPAAAQPSSAAPRQLPADTRLFSGRTEQLEELSALAAGLDDHADAGMVVISAIDGMGGIGKTALAVRAAHRMADRFPDGQLFIDLRGHDAKLAPSTAEDALDYLLRSLGVPPNAIPADPDERAALYRSRLAGTRTLILLDNAANTAQVRPLLPGTPGCLALITSRTRMMGLDDAHFFALEALSPAEAIALLRMVSGRGRLDDESSEREALELVELCGLVPLAVRIVAARLRHDRQLTVAGLVEQLREESGRMTHLRDDERDLANVFETSYRDLPKPEARLFRLLGLLPGPDFDAHTAANLAGIGLPEATRQLDLLLAHNLVMRPSPDRYQMHDLLRAYTRGLGTDPEEERACLDRALDYYEYTAVTAARLLARRHRPPSAGPRTVPDPVRELTDHTEAAGWLTTERGNLLALMEHVTQPARQVSLTAALATFFRSGVTKGQQLVLHQAAVEISGAEGWTAQEAEALLNLAHVHRTDGGFDVAIELLRRALDDYRAVGDVLGEANAQCELGRVFNLIGPHARAAEEQQRALELYRGLGDRSGEADSLYELSRVDLQTGKLDSARELAERALAAFRELGKPMGEAQVLVVLGNLRRRAGAFEEAAELLQQSVATFREAHDKQSESNALWTLGQIRFELGDVAAAGKLLERSLALSREVGTRHGVAGNLGVLGTIRLAAGEVEEAIVLLRESMTIFQAIGHRTGMATAQQHLAKALRINGDDAAALELLTSAMAIFEEAGDQEALATAWNMTGAHQLAAEGAQAALDWYRRALTTARAVNARPVLAEALDGVAHCLAPTDLAGAIEAQREAVELYRSLSVPELAEAEAYLASLTAAEDAARAG